MGLIRKFLAALEKVTDAALRDLGLLAMRLMFGLGMLLAHGYGKLTGFMKDPSAFADPIGLGTEVSYALAVFAEFFCAILVVLGLFTRAALIPLIVTMLVAFFVVHGADDFGTKEKAFLYLAGYVGLLLAGPGKFSGDFLLRKAVK